MQRIRRAGVWQRIAWLVGVFVISIPFFWMLTLLMGWWVLVIVIPGVWASWDYLARGDMVGPVDSASVIGKFLPDGFNRKRRP